MLLTLNVGSGNRTYKEYPPGYKCINFDIRENLVHIDEVGDVKDLSRFNDEHFDYILASDIIEHFKISEVDLVLKEWVRVLKTGGTIEFRLPNLEAIATDYIKRKDENRTDMFDVPISHYFNWLLGGAQNYCQNVHYTQYDRRLFKYVCEKSGLSEISWTRDGYNMTVKFIKL